jgi:hypothetical protein
MNFRPRDSLDSLVISVFTQLNDTGALNDPEMADVDPDLNALPSKSRRKTCSMSDCPVSRSFCRR